ncbi:hypothetical protein HRbin36_02542 [bacterium HR36]|nr:hypothetical protein HRbin36_02542 [bacterium HR36]
MEVIVTEGKPFHIVWEIGGKGCHAAGTDLGRLTVEEVAVINRIEGCVHYYREGRPVLIFGDRILSRSGHWFPVLNRGLALEGRVGCHAITCASAPITAWSCGNYHIPLYLLSHSGVGSVYCLSHSPQGAGNDMIIPILGPPVILPKQQPPLLTPAVLILPSAIDPCPSRHRLLAR